MNVLSFSRLQRPLMLLACGVLIGGCGTGETRIQIVEVLVNCEDVAAGDVEPDGAVWDVGPDGAVEDVELDGGVDAGPDGEDAGLAEDAGPVLDPIMAGETDGSAVIFSEEAFEGLFIFGIGAEPTSALAQVGNTAVGAIALPTVVEFTGDLLVIRVVDVDSQEAVPGEEGIIEAYDAQLLDDGRVRVDFSEPKIALDIQLWQNCTYVLQSYLLGGDPLYSDGLLTWAALEHYASEKCGNQGLAESTGMNFHFLRRADANPDFLPRGVDETSPFGFFQASSGDEPLLNRMPHTGPEYGDGEVVYFLSDSFPPEFRPVAHEVIAHWNDVLEEAAGNRPLKLLEGSPAFLPWDPRFRVIEWNDSQSLGAIAPFIEDPLTGELFETDVIMWLGGLDQLVEKYQDFFAAFPDAPIGDFQPGEGFEAFGPPPMFLPQHWNRGPKLPPRVIRRRAFPTKHFGVTELHEMAQHFAMSLSAEELQAYIVADFLNHEIGHNLGLRHNFKASADLGLIGDGATATSTMDYVVGMTEPGTYDRDAMAYGYGAGPNETGYLFCTDQDLGTDPGCARWDYGDPLLHAIHLLDKLAGKYPPETPTEELLAIAEAEEWGELFNRVRQFFNTPYETWDPDTPHTTYMFLVDRVVCAVPEGESCPTHLWFRQQYALYTLYSKYVFQGEWVDFSMLSTQDAELLLGHYYMLILDPNQPAALRKTIVDKLPTSNVEGADGLLATLLATLQFLEEPNEDEAAILAWVEAAMGL